MVYSLAKKIQSSPWVFPSLILLIACALRLWHLDRWLPQVFEEATAVVRARDFWGWDSGHFDFNPNFFNYPALSFYIHFLCQSIVLALGWLTGQFASLTEFRQALVDDFGWFVLLGRIVTVLFDLGTVALAYTLGQRLGGLRCALVSALLLAINSLHITMSQYVQVDVPLAFFVLLTLIALLDIATQNRRNDYLRAGLYIGLATATKYTAALLVVPMVAAALPQFLQRQSRLSTLKHLSLGLIISLVLFLALNPYILLSFDTFLKHFSFERRHMALGHFGHDTTKSTLWFYTSLLWNTAGIAAIAALVALWQAAHQRHFAQGLLFGWVIIYTAVVASWSMHAERYLMPVVPALLVAGALGVDWLANGLRSLFNNPGEPKARGSRRWARRPKEPILRNMGPLGQRRSTCGAAARRPAGLLKRLLRGWQQKMVLSAFLVLYTLPQGFLLERHYAAVGATDTRVEAKEWIEVHLAPKTLVAAEHYTYEPAATSPEYLLVRLPLDPVHPETIAPFYNYDWYQNFDYILTSSDVSQRYGEDPEAFPVQTQFYLHLEQHWPLAASFSPEKSIGPQIRIYRNPATDRVDRGFSLDLYRSLDAAGIDEAQQFLSYLGYALNQAGFARQARDISQKISLIERMKGRRRRR